MQSSLMWSSLRKPVITDVVITKEAPGLLSEVWALSSLSMLVITKEAPGHPRLLLEGF
jgi:hypothetical protein